MKKLPWGILSGALAMLSSFLLVAVIVIYVANVMTAELNKTVFTIFDTWYQTLLFVALLLCFAGMVFCLVMYIRAYIANKKSKPSDAEDKK